MTRGAAYGLAVLLAAAPCVAQVAPELAPQAAAGVLTLDQDRLFAGSLFGQRIVADIEAASRLLASENRRIEADLSVEEKALTARRATLPAAEFRGLADAFDQKVGEIRSTQENKARALISRREAEQKRFFEAALPVLSAILRDIGAVAILDSKAIFLSSDRVDVTDEAIARINTVLGDGTPIPDAVPDARQDAPPPGAAAP